MWTRLKDGSVRFKIFPAVKLFSSNQNKQKLQQNVIARFLELTQLKVRKFLQLELDKSCFFFPFKLEVGNSYSNKVCGRCNDELLKASLWRKELVSKQLSLYKFEADLRIAEARRYSSDLDSSEEARSLTENNYDSDDSVELEIEAEEYVFNDGTAINEQSSSSPLVQAQSRKKFCNQENKAIGSDDGEEDMFHHELDDNIEDHPVEQKKGQVPLRRIKPAKRQEHELRGKPVTPEKKKFVCLICENFFKDLYNLKRHMNEVRSRISNVTYVANSKSEEIE